MLFGGVQLFALGLIGEYIARIHVRSMGRPAYLEDREPTPTSANDDPPDAVDEPDVMGPPPLGQQSFRFSNRSDAPDIDLVRRAC